MAEFCFECWNKINGTNDPKSKYIISKDVYFCEHCCQWKRVIVEPKKYYYKNKIRKIMMPFIIIWRILMIPVTLYKFKKIRQKELK